MERPVRIAVVGSVDEGSLAQLRQTTPPAEVCAVPSIAAGTATLLAFQPELLLVRFGDQARREELGAVQVLQGMWPKLRVAVLGSGADLDAIRAELGARGLPLPVDAAPLAELVQQLRVDGQRARQQLFVDVAHGLGDEINNPLLFASGHLQLLRATMGAADRNARDQVDAALDGLQRIRRSVDRLLLLSEAADGPARRERVDLCGLLGEAVAARASDTSAATLSIREGPAFVLGDPVQLGRAVAAVVEFADDVAALASGCHLQLDRCALGHRLRLTASGAELASWQPRRSFQPFYPHRALRGRSRGLGLFLAQVVVHGHGGGANARWTVAGALELEFTLPATDA